MQLTWNEFEKVILSYQKEFTPDDADRNFSYQDFIGNQRVIQLRTDPREVPTDWIREEVISGFLNRWGRCRISNAQQVATCIQNEVQDLVPLFQVLNALTIETQIDFDQDLTIQGNQLTIRNAVEQCYMCLKGNGIGPTSTSKLLHILHPNLFVMWNEAIRNHYTVNDRGAGYCTFLQRQNQIAMQLCESFKNAELNPAAGVNQSPADYLSKKLGYNPPKTFAKYINEYNWSVLRK